MAIHGETGVNVWTRFVPQEVLSSWDQMRPQGPWPAPGCLSGLVSTSLLSPTSTPFPHPLTLHGVLIWSYPQMVLPTRYH